MKGCSSKQRKPNGSLRSPAYPPRKDTPQCRQCCTMVLWCIVQRCPCMSHRLTNRAQQFYNAVRSRMRVMNSADSPLQLVPAKGALCGPTTYPSAGRWQPRRVFHWRRCRGGQGRSRVGCINILRCLYGGTAEVVLTTSISATWTYSSCSYYKLPLQHCLETSCAHPVPTYACEHGVVLFTYRRSQLYSRW